MKKVHEKSIVLGVGIGMIITAIASMIFTAGMPKELSKTEIINLAKGYGLIEQAKVLNGEKTSNDSMNSDDVSTDTDNSNIAESTVTAITNAVDTSSDSTTDDNNSSNSTERNIIIEIKEGYKSQNVINILLEKEVISSGKDFSDMLDSYKTSKNIRIGNYKFKKNEDLHYIIKTICYLK